MTTSTSTRNSSCLARHWTHGLLLSAPGAGRVRFRGCSWPRRVRESRGGPGGLCRGVAICGSLHVPHVLHVCAALVALVGATDVLHVVEVDVEPAPVSGVEQAELNFADLAGEVLLRRVEHLGSVADDDGMLRVEMQGWALELEPSMRLQRP